MIRLRVSEYSILIFLVNQKSTYWNQIHLTTESFSFFLIIVAVTPCPSSIVGMVMTMKELHPLLVLRLVLPGGMMRLKAKVKHPEVILSHSTTKVCFALLLIGNIA